MKLLKKNKIKIVAFGTSTVLQNNSIFDSLQKKFNEEKFNNIEIEKYGYGGLNITHSPCFIKNILNTNPNIVILDWFDSTFIPKKSKVKESFEAIGYLLNKFNIKTIIYLHYRLDHDSKREAYNNIIINLSNKFKFPIYHDIGYYRIGEEYRDVVHTTQKGSDVIASEFYNFLRKINYKKNKLSNKIIKKLKNNPLTKVFYKKLKPLNINGLYEKDSKEYFIINKNSTIQINTKNIDKIIGFEMKIGPYSGIVSFNKLNVQLFDPWSYYERETIAVEIKTNTNKLIIKIENKPVDYTVSRVKFVNLEQKQEIKIRGFYYV